MEDQKKDQAPPAAPAAPAAPKVKLVKVKVLRPFRIDNDALDPTIYDRVGSVVSVPESEVPRLTKVMTGQVKGFGERLEEETGHHEFKLAELA